MTTRFAFFTLLLLVSATARTLIAAEPSPSTAHWSLESTSEFKLHGNAKPVDGVVGKCLAMTGDSVITIKESSQRTEGEAGYTFAAWGNPFYLERGQQIIAGENRYSLHQRQWGLMIDRDGHFRAYFWQGGWEKIAASSPPKPILVGVVCQFVIMSALAFLCVQLFGLNAEVAAGLILIGSCPGDVSSNVIAYIADANVPLSVTVTACSTLCSPETT